MKNFRPHSKENKKVKYTQFLGLCKSCGICIEKCPTKCLKNSDDKYGYYGLPGVDIDIDKCIACGLCERSCPEQAIIIEKKETGKPVKTDKNR